MKVFELHVNGYKHIKNKMKVSIITVVYNNVECIGAAIESVLNQDYGDIEYVIIDAESTDGTVDIIKEYRNKIDVFISESDNGIYDALNKGITQASGDIIAILHSDDKFCDERVVSDMMKHIEKTKAELCFSDMVIIDNLSGQVLRYYMAHYFKKWMFRIGWMPPHPTCFINKSLFDEFGLYSLKYKIAGDFDLLIRFFYGRKIKWSYLDRISIKMSSGGVSNSGLQSKKLVYSEINRSLKSNNVWSLPVFQLARYVIRLMEVIIKPKKGRYD
jgi:glycosyltransferase involved in cell wall biosynthesis